MNRIPSISQRICCYLPEQDFEKALLLAAIAKEEGAGLVTIEIPEMVINEKLQKLAAIKMKTILSPKNYFPISHQSDKSSREKSTEKEIVERFEILIKQLTKLLPFGIELPAELPVEKLRELVNYLSKKGIKSIINLFFQKTPTIKQLEVEIKNLPINEASCLKCLIPIKKRAESLTFLTYQVKQETAFILNCYGEEGKIAQLFSPFFGGQITYAFLSRKTPGALIPINQLKKQLESLQELFPMAKQKKW
jgi:3-dehydroquinate dehydratase